MSRIAMSRIHPEIQRKEREAEPLILLHMPELVVPQRVGRLAREHEDMAEGDPDIATAREDEVRQPAVADVQEASVTEARPRE
jgi:hypothetical protein